MNTIPTILRKCSPFQIDIYQISRKHIGRLFAVFFFGISFLFGVFLSSLYCITPAEASSHTVKLLEIPATKGSIPKILTFPLYEQESIQYFSAGLGKEERALTYPPFPLKIVFVQGERAFLAGVSVRIMKEDRTQLLMIPGEEVEGPWLFLKIPTGTYLVNGTNSKGTTIEKTITIQTAKFTIVHLRFP